MGVTHRVGVVRAGVGGVGRAVGGTGRWEEVREAVRWGGV